MCFNTNNGVNEVDNKRKYSDNNLDFGSYNDSDIVKEAEEVLDTDWSIDVWEYMLHSKMLAKNCNKNYKNELTVYAIVSDAFIKEEINIFNSFTNLEFFQY
jgi:hypothetical protein